MARERLPGEELGEGRYRILKTLTFAEEGGVYAISDLQTQEPLILKEVIPPASLDEEELKRREALLQEALLILTQFEHPNLSRIHGHFSEGRRQYVVMERVEGITLRALMEMAVKPLPERQVLAWTLSLCEALHYLRDRPRPFLFGDLDPSHIMMTPEQGLKLIHYGLDRFFLAEAGVSFSANREELAREMQRFGQTLVYLLTREEPGLFGISAEEHRISRPLAEVVNRLLSGEPQRTWPSYQELARELERILHPPPISEARPQGPARPWVRILDFRRIWQDLVWAFLGQPLYKVALEVLGLALAMIGGWILTHPPIQTRSGPAAYVSCGAEIYAIDARSRRVLTRIPLDQEVTGLAATPDGGKLFAAAPSAARIYVINPRSHQVIGWIPVEAGPQRLLMSPSGRWLHVLHPQSGQLGSVRIDPAPLPLQATNRRPKDTMTALFAGGGGASGLALLPPRRPGDPEGDRILLASERGDRITLFEPEPPVVLAQQESRSPGPITAHPDGGPLYLVQRGTDRITTLDPTRLTRTASIPDSGGSQTRQLLFNPAGTELWAVHGSGSLAVIHPERRTLRQRLPLPGSPGEAAFRSIDGIRTELWVTLLNTGEVAVIDPVARTVDKRIQVGELPTSICLIESP